MPEGLQREDLSFTGLAWNLAAIGGETARQARGICVGKPGSPKAARSIAHYKKRVTCAATASLSSGDI